LQLGRMPDVKRKIPAIIANRPLIRAEISAAVLGSAFLNCQPTPKYHEILGKNKPTAPIIIKRTGINVNMNIRDHLFSRKSDGTDSNNAIRWLGMAADGPNG